MRANLGDVKNGSFEPLPQGNYQVKVIMADPPIVGELKADGTEKAPYVKARFKVLTGDYAGRLIFKNFIWTEKALPFLKPFLLAIGYPTDQEVEIVPEQWINEQLVVQIGHERNNGKVRDVPVNYYSLSSQGLELAEDVPF